MYPNMIRLLLLSLGSLIVQRILCEYNTSCSVSYSYIDNQQSYEYLIVWDDIKRLIFCNDQAQVVNIKESLESAFKEKVYEESGIVLELWSGKLLEYYELQDNVYIANNSKIHVKEIFNVTVNLSGVYSKNSSMVLEDPKSITRIKTEQDLRAELLKNYDNSVWPWIEMGQPCYVITNIQFSKVIDVDLQHGSLTMLVWFRLRWNDPRFTWDPEDWNDINITHFKQHEFWDPEIEIWNSEDSIGKLLEEQMAYVSYEGDLFWSRLGQIRVTCGMKGLTKFPYDSSQCKLDVGSWAYDITKVELAYHEKGYEIDSTQMDAPFAEYKISKIVVNINNELPFFDVYPQNDTLWPVVEYDISIRRHHVQYTYGIILPQGLLTALSFAAFWLPPPSGERIGFTITIPLAIAVYKILMYQQLPAAAELVFATKFSFGCFLFTIFVVAESIFVAILWHRTDPYFFAPLRSFRKLIIDFREMWDRTNIIKAVDVEMSHQSHRKAEYQSGNLYLKIKMQVSKVTGSMKRSNSSSSEIPNQNQNNQNSSSSSIQVSKNQNQLSSSSLSVSKKFNDLESQTSEVIKFPIQTVEKARLFLFEVLHQKQYSKALKSYEHLCKRYSEQDVQNDLFRLMGVVDGASSDLMHEAKKIYNTTWQKLSNVIDRVCQLTMIPMFILFIVIITLQLV